MRSRFASLAKVSTGHYAESDEGKQVAESDDPFPGYVPYTGPDLVSSEPLYQDEDTVFIEFPEQIAAKQGQAYGDPYSYVTMNFTDQLVRAARSGKNVVIDFTNCKGGNTLAMQQLYEQYMLPARQYIEQNGRKMMTVTDGLVASAAVPLFMCGSHGHRVATSDAKFLIHDTQLTIQASITEFEEWIQNGGAEKAIYHGKDANLKYAVMIARESLRPESGDYAEIDPMDLEHKTRNILEYIYSEEERKAKHRREGTANPINQRDAYLSIEEAKEFGFVDKVTDNDGELSAMIKALPKPVQDVVESASHLLTRHRRLAA